MSITAIGSLTIVVLASLALLMLLAVVRRIAPRLMARFDLGTLRAPLQSQPQPPHGTDPGRFQETRIHRELWAWCFAGAGSGASPALLPWVKPEVIAPLSIAVTSGFENSHPLPLVESLALQLDGSIQLMRMGSRAARLAFRLQIKLLECAWWRARQEGDPWDCGWLIDQAQAPERLRRFKPRRATLIVADRLVHAALAPCVCALVEASAGFEHPVRLLVLAAAPPAELALASEGTQCLRLSALPGLGMVTLLELQSAPSAAPSAAPVSTHRD